MKSLCFLLTSAEWNGTEHMALRLLEALPIDPEKKSILVIKGEGPLLEQARKADIEARALNFRFFLDPFGAHRLERELRRLRPTVLQTFLFRANAWAGLLHPLFPSTSLFLSERCLDLNRRYAQVLLTRHAARRAVAVTAVSQAVQTILIHRERIPEEKIHVIPNGLPNSFFENPPPARSRDDLLPGTSPLIGTICGFRREKSLPVLVQAFRRFLDVCPTAGLVLGGDGPEMPAIRSLVQDLRLEDHIRFLGFVEDVRSVLPSLDLFVLPSREEGFPGVLLEALGMGLPCVASRIGGNLEILTEEYGEFFEPEDVADLTRAISALWENETKRKRARENGTDYIRKNFPASRMVEAYWNLYRPYLER
ncbi:MAG: glycosyltransferase family 1 protein [Candidatus Hydrogenedentota bacterium]|nr:MAG: glycosyltransferase family 1 protein [Candidatus Hydrogenedentota bacterium]